MPETPALTAEAFPEPIRLKAQGLIKGVDASPTDPWANGDLAMFLHASRSQPLR